MNAYMILAGTFGVLLLLAVLGAAVAIRASRKVPMLPSQLPPARRRRTVLVPYERRRNPAVDVEVA